jgi:hypothetical protein
VTDTGEPTFAVYLVMIEDTNRAFERMADNAIEYSLINDKMTEEEASLMVNTSKIIDQL